MRAAVLEGPRHMVIRSVPEPRAREGEVVVRVRTCGICGSDLYLYEKGFGSLHRIMGHEFSGDIVSAGEGVEGWKAGDRVAIEPTMPCGRCPPCLRQRRNLCSSLKFTGIERDGGFAEYVAVPAYQLHRIPDKMTYEQAALAEPMAVALHAVSRGDIQRGDRVAVLGAGPIGLLVMEWARAAGAGRIIATEVAESRIATARKLSDEILNPVHEDVVEKIRESTDGLGPDVVFECTGSSTAEVQSMMLAKKGGRVVLVGAPHGETSVPLGLFLGEITVTGAFAYASLEGLSEFAMCLDSLESGKMDVSKIPTTTIPLEDIVEMGFQNTDGTGKVLVIP